MAWAARLAMVVLGLLGLLQPDLASAQAVVNPTQTVASPLSRPQVDVLKNIYRFTTLRFEADRGPYVVAVSEAMNARIVPIFREKFGNMPVGSIVAKPNSDPRQQGRLLCSLLTEQAAGRDMVVFLLRCEMGNRMFNATHRRSIGVVSASMLIPAVQQVLQQHLGALGEMFVAADPPVLQ